MIHSLILCKNFSIKSVNLNSPSKIKIFNSSVVQFKNKVFFISRSKVFCHSNRRIHDAVNFIHQFDENLNLIKLSRLDDSVLLLKSSEAKNGIEDIRLFIWNDSIWGIGASLAWQGHAYKISPTLIKIENCKITKFYELNSNFSKDVEKNWTPLVKDNKLYLLYSLDPMVVFQFVGSKLALVKSHSASSIKKLKIHGGTPAIKFLGGSFLGVAHKLPLILFGQLFYRHFFYLLDKDFNLKMVSREFALEKFGIEFPCGLILLGKNLLLSYGSMDNSARFIKIPKKEIVGLLK
jgi:predicted GH43/DUF377 family glycosyl hydrolase